MKEKISDLSSNTINALRFPLIIGVVFIHFYVFGIPVQGVECRMNPPFWLVCIDNLFRDVIARIGVPLFFIISGYLSFWSGLTTDSYKQKVTKSARTLLVPYILWNSIFILNATVCSLPSLHSLFSDTLTDTWSFRTILSCFWNNAADPFSNHPQPYNLLALFDSVPIDYPLWYVRNLMIAVILSPLVYWTINKVGWYVVIGFGIIWGIVAPYEHYTLMTMFFFSWGACLAIKRLDFVKSMRRFHSALYFYPVVAIADMLTKRWEYNIYLHNIGIILGIFAAVSLTATLLEKGRLHVNKFLANASFFVFALHALFIKDTAKVIIKIFFYNSPIYMAALFFIVPLTTIAICLVLYWLLRRFTPRLCALLTGGR